MDEKTKLLVSLGAAVAANCVPCFEHSLEKTKAAGLTLEEIREATEIADPLFYP
jgi:alkylhydroperoxidase/carboxymuconolactone decarboxylase family protein YurZ